MKYGGSKRHSRKETGPSELILYRFGMGSLFIWEKERQDRQDYPMVMQIADAFLDRHAGRCGGLPIVS